ncbi:MAG: cytochrome c biogenesis protein CcdA [Bacteroidales bacterium]|nr:cytochrome c biogenesis protein CcdA [Bacteroidales bacterium]
MTKRFFLIFFLSVLGVCAALAQISDPVKWKSAVKMTDATNGVVTFTATIDGGWHVYGTSLPAGGPEPTSVQWNNQGVKLVGGLTPNKPAHKQHDETFDMDLSWWTGSVTLTQKFTVTGKEYKIEGNIRSMACNDESCTPPKSESFSFKGTASQAATAEVIETPAASATAVETVAVAAQSSSEVKTADSAVASPSQDQLWAPVKAVEGENADVEDIAGSSLWYIFWACFLGGFLALLTPCVWPMIPMTVSFFLKKSGSRAKAISNAITYGLSIIIIFLLLGVCFTALFGASALNALATSAWCNLLFFALLVIFAISFFGAFEITLPQSLSNKMDSTASKTTGLISIFFMAATLVIVSFSCTGPIIGTLLVEAASQGSILGPVVGMTGFAIALAIPFTLFALFPSMLKKMPKSGGWLNTVKVVLGFIELALSLKFLSVADLAYGWHILDRETFLALWIAIFGIMGLYLLGMFRFNSDGETKTSGIGVTRFFLALASLSFTAYLIPGLWGAPLKATSAFVPPLYTQDFNLYGGEQVEYDDFDEGMKAAATQGKAVFVDFSGYGCVNCRKMEGAVLDEAEVKQTITENFVTIKLMVDDKTPLEKPMVVEENGRQTTLSTVGDKWSYLQRHKFNSNSQPYYVVLNQQGELLSGPFAYKEDIDAFLTFLKKGLNK